MLSDQDLALIECIVPKSLRVFFTGVRVADWTAHLLDAAREEGRQSAGDRVKALEEALKPFAEVADWYDASEPDTFEVWMDYPHGFINRSVARLANYRRAAALLSPQAAPVEQKPNTRELVNDYYGKMRVSDCNAIRAKLSLPDPDPNSPKDARTQDLENAKAAGKLLDLWREMQAIEASDQKDGAS